MLNGGRVRSRRRLVGAVGAAVVVMAATVAAPGTAHAALDATNPVLVAATRTTPATVSGNQAVGVRVQATDAGGSHLTVARIKFRQANGTEFEASAGYAGQALDEIDDVVTATTSTWLANGTYEAQYVEIDDGDGNSVRYGRDGRIMRGILDVGGHSISVAALDVVVNNPRSDATPPRLSGVALRSATVAAGDPIVMTYSAADVGSGVGQVNALYQSPGAAVPVWLRSTIEGDYGSSGFASGVIPATLPGGSYALSYVVVVDLAGNSTYYSPGSPDTVATTPVGLVQPPAIDLDALALTVVQPNPPDVTAPHLTALSLISSDRRLGESATFGFTVTDASPVVEARIFLDDPDGRRTVAIKRCGPFAPGKVSFWFPPDVPTGRWDVTGVTVTDAAGNIRTYAPTGAGEQTGQPTHTGPSFASMHVDLTTGSIRPDPVAVPDSCAEPVVTTSVSPTYAVAGSTAAVSGRVSFGGVPVASPSVAVFAGTGTASRFVGLTTGTASGTYSLPVRITGSTTLRAYFLGSGRTNLGEAFGPAVTVRAGAAARVVAGDTSVRVPRGARKTLTAHVVPRRAGVTATLWRRAGGTWKIVATDRSNAKGTVSHRIQRPKRTTSFRWTTPYYGGYLPATSATIVVKR
jgi:hypothetical protein